MGLLSSIGIGKPQAQAEAPVVVPDELPSLPSEHKAEPTPTLPPKNTSIIPEELPDLPKRAEAPKPPVISPLPIPPPAMQRPAQPSPTAPPTQPAISPVFMSQQTQPITQVTSHVSTPVTPPPLTPTQFLSTTKQKEPTQTAMPIDDKGYFSSIEKALDNPSAMKSVLESDFVQKMRQYHIELAEDADLMIAHARTKNDIALKLTELKKLEYAWHEKHHELKNLEEEIIKLETMIDENSDELKSLFRLLSSDPRYTRISSIDRAFYLADGRMLRTIRDLIDALKTMSEDVFTHHVNSSKNDFASWIIDVFRIKELESSLRSCRTPKDFIDILSR